MGFVNTSLKTSIILQSLTLAVSNKHPSKLGPVSGLILIAISTIGERLALINNLLNSVSFQGHLVSRLIASIGGIFERTATNILEGGERRGRRRGHGAYRETEKGKVQVM